MEDDAPVARYDLTTGLFRLWLPGGQEVQIGGLGAGLALWRETGSESIAAPLWLSPSQADVLDKMIAYVLQTVRISPASRQALEAIQPQVAQLKVALDAIPADLDANASAEPPPSPDDDEEPSTGA
jgi:hypothetical protein